jgi:phosphoribosyl-ATP pyrophosphohydrolase/phosphoribosyl-AMP cyclohydrolase
MEGEIINKLYSLILERKKNLPEGSYTTELFKKGREEILKKVGEESIEVIVASSREEMIYEIADLLYHLLVLMAYNNILPVEVFHELEKRFGKSGIKGNYGG